VYRWRKLPLIMLVVLSLLFMLIFSSVAFGVVATDEINVTLTNDPWISISTSADVNLGNITAKGVNVSNNTTWTVESNNWTGYNLSVKASQTSAMRLNANSSYYFEDYDGTADTPTAWSVASDKAYFGFSANGTDVDAKWGNGTKYAGFTGTTGITVASNNSYQGTGIDTGVYFQAGVGSGKNLPSGGYTAVITATAATNP